MVELHWKDKHRQEPIDSSIRQPVIVDEAIASDLDLQPASSLEQDGWRNRLILGDALDIAAALLPELSGRIDLVYIDPPFMTGRDFMNGTQLAYSDKWNDHLDSYLSWLYEILTLLHRLLTVEGSIYIHLDWRVVHYAKVLLDEVFGYSPNADGAGFKNEIIWHYQSGGRATNRYARKHDTILFYTKSARYCFHGERIGEQRGAHKRNHMRKLRDEQGRVSWSINSHGRTYTYSAESLMTPSDVWSDISHLHQRDPERNGYATQKPAALLERILLASSEPGYLVLDCFCGSGVTPCMAEKLGRRWIASDLGELAISTTRARLLALPQRAPFVVQQVCQPLDAIEV